MQCLNNAYCSTGTVAAYNVSVTDCRRICVSTYNSYLFSFSVGNECICGSSDNCAALTIRTAPSIAVYGDNLEVSTHAHLGNA